jgi:hypothetical protein
MSPSRKSVKSPSTIRLKPKSGPSSFIDTYPSRHNDLAMPRYFFILILALAACNSQNHNNSLPATFPAEDIQSAAATFCSQGFELEEIPVSGDFDRLGSGVKVFGFSSGKGRCAVEKDIHDNNLGLTWFNLTGVNGCVENGSLWEITKSSTATPNHYYELRNLKDTRLLDMNGARDLGAAYARDHAGVRPLKCVQK